MKEKPNIENCDKIPKDKVIVTSLPQDKHNVWVKVLCYSYKRKKHDIIRKRKAYRNEGGWFVNYSNSEGVFVRTKDDFILTWCKTKNFC